MFPQGINIGKKHATDFLLIAHTFTILSVFSPPKVPPSLPYTKFKKNENEPVEAEFERRKHS